MIAQILYTILFLTATVSSWGQLLQRVLHESEINREGQPVKLRILLREIEYRGVKFRPGAPMTRIPPRQGTQISVTRQIGADGPELELYSYNYDGMRLADAKFRGQLQTDGENFWVYLSSDITSGRGTMIEMSLMAPGNRLEDHYDHEEAMLQLEAGTRLSQSFRSLSVPTPPKGMEFSIDPYPKMTLENGLLCFYYPTNDPKEKRIVRYTPAELASKVAPVNAPVTKPEQPAPPAPSPSGGMPKPNAGEVVPPQAPIQISQAENPSNKWLLWAAVAVLILASVGFLLKRHQK